MTQPPSSRNNSLFHRCFIAHPQSAGECYFRHLHFAIKVAFLLFWAGLCLILHGLFPFLFEKTASDIIGRLSKTLEERRRKVAAAKT